MSHALTLRKHFAVTTRPPGAVPGAAHAVAVDGTPADTVMVALASPVFFDPPPAVAAAAAAEAGAPAPPCPFAVVVSGINRGDNAGQHVIYSGTVGAAREAALNGVPAVAVSLADLGAEGADAYRPAAAGTAAIVAALLTEEGGALAAALTGGVVNLNFPRPGGRAGIGPGVVVPASADATPAGSDDGGASEGAPPTWRGFQLARQGGQAARPGFIEQFVPTTKNGDGGSGGGGDGDGAALPAAAAATRFFKNVGGGMRWDTSPGTDTAALAAGWASVTALSLRQDVRVGPGAKDDGEGRAWDAAAADAIVKVVVAAGRKAGVEVGGV
jgi:5'-nucleotidase